MHTYMGFSTGEWNGDILTITTTHIKAGYFRRSGVPASDRITVVEHWMRHGPVLSQVTIATDPVYLTVLCSRWPNVAFVSSHRMRQSGDRPQRRASMTHSSLQR